MSSGARSSTRTALARVGFSELAAAHEHLAELAELVELPHEAIVAAAAGAADPDGAAAALVRIARRNPDAVAAALQAAPRPVWLLLGASEGFADFFLRHPEELAELDARDRPLPTAAEMQAELRAAVRADADGFAAAGD